jgi:hypothetical protein
METHGFPFEYLFFTEFRDVAIIAYAWIISINYDVQHGFGGGCSQIQPLGIC